VRLGTQRAQSAATQNEKVSQHINRTRMTRIGRIFTDTHYPCASAQSVFYRNPAINKDNEPQINADERRYLLVTYFIKKTHRKGRKERKARQQESLRSLRLNAFFAPAHVRAQPMPAVHLRSSRAGMSMEDQRMMNSAMCQKNRGW